MLLGRVDTICPLEAHPHVLGFSSDPGSGRGFGVALPGSLAGADSYRPSRVHLRSGLPYRGICLRPVCSPDVGRCMKAMPNLAVNRTPAGGAGRSERPVGAGYLTR